VDQGNEARHYGVTKMMTQPWGWYLQTDDPLRVETDIHGKSYVFSGEDIAFWAWNRGARGKKQCRDFMAECLAKRPAAQARQAIEDAERLARFRAAVAEKAARRSARAVRAADAARQLSLF
jgi:hypothetical protein